MTRVIGSGLSLDLGSSVYWNYDLMNLPLSEPYPVAVTVQCSTHTCTQYTSFKSNTLLIMQNFVNSSKRTKIYLNSKPETNAHCSLAHELYSQCNS